MSNPLKSTPSSKTLRQSVMPTLLSLALAVGVGYGMVHAERAMLGAEAPVVVVAASAAAAPTSPGSGLAGTSVALELPVISGTVSNVVVLWNGAVIPHTLVSLSLSWYARVVAPSGSGVVPVNIQFDFKFQGVTYRNLSRDYTFTYAPPVPPAVPPAITSLAPWSGSLTGGTTVTITGTNLNGATAVSFGGTAGTIVGTPTATEMRVTTPAKAAGLVDVRVTTPAGTSAVANTAKFFYDDTTITWVLPSFDNLFTPAAFAPMAAAIQQRLPDGPKAKAGLSVFTPLNMNSYTLTPSNST